MFLIDHIYLRRISGLHGDLHYVDRMNTSNVAVGVFFCSLLLLHVTPCALAGCLEQKLAHIMRLFSGIAQSRPNLLIFIQERCPWLDEIFSFYPLREKAFPVAQNWKLKFRNGIITL